MAEDTSTISSSNSDCLNSSLSESSDNDSDDICFDLLGNSINELSDENFRLYFRVNRIVAEEIIEKYQSFYNDLPSIHHIRRILPHIQVYILLWYLGNVETFVIVANRFSITRSETQMTIRKVMKWLTAYSSDYIKWPTRERRMEIVNNIKTINGLPNVAGIMGYCHISVPPAVSRRDEFNTIILQAVVDDERRFVDICVGLPEMNYDDVLRQSKCYHTLNDPTKRPSYLDENQLILGDESYPNYLKWLVPPFNDVGNLTHEYKSFNRIHYDAYSTIHVTFDVLKCRFKKLKGFLNFNNNFVKSAIMVTCILHNLCLDVDDNGTDFLRAEEEKNNPKTRQQELFMEMAQNGIL